MYNQGSTLEKKPWGQLAPKFLDLVASTIFLVAKNSSGRKLSLEISAVQTVYTAFSSVQRKSKDEKPHVTKTLMLHCFSFIIFHRPVIKKNINCREKML